jgi:hypothetical protein
MGIGDELMLAGHAERLFFTNGRRRVHVRDRRGRPRWHELWGGNPYLVRTPHDDMQILVQGPGCRPYIAGGDAARWTWQPYRPHPATVVLTPAELAYGEAHAGAIIVEPTLKPRAPVSKQYPADQWRAVIASMGRLPLLRLRGDDPEGYGVRLLHTPTIRHAAAVMRFARAYVGHEGALHHLAAACRTPAVVIMGGYIGPEHTGYDLPQHRYLTGPEPVCGSRGPCIHCDRAMRSITPDDVVRHLAELLDAY